MGLMETVKIVVEGVGIDEVAGSIQNNLRNANLTVQVRPLSTSFDGFSLDPATIIVAGTGVVSTLITALLTYLSSRKSGTIIITGASGRKIEIPKDTPKERIEYYVTLAKQIDANLIKLKSHH
jgi:hypothetical protein